MAILQNTSISGTNSITLPAGPTYLRPLTETTIIRWTRSGATVLQGNVSDVSNTSWTCPSGVSKIELLVVAGGGGGGGGFTTWAGGGGGGAGGLIYRGEYPVTANQTYNLTVGAGGSGQAGDTSPRYGFSGGNSIFGPLTAIGGGGGNSWNSSTGSTAPAGGSGGGGQNSSGPFGGAAGTPGQGFPGGDGMAYTGSNQSSAAGGGGAGGPGGRPTGPAGGGGGPGIMLDITGQLVTYAAGGGGGGGVTGGGSQNGGNGGNGTGSNGSSVEANTGGGGGGAGSTVSPNNATTGSNGADGVIVIRYTRSLDGSDLIGTTRYNDEATTIEIFEDYENQWVAQDQRKNFAGHNLGLYSEEFNQTSAYSYQAVSVTANSGIAPNGTSTADLVIDNNSNARHELYKGFSGLKSNAKYTYSVFVKPAGKTFTAIAFGGSPIIGFNLSDGTVSSPNGAITGTITRYPNGWFRISATAAPGATTTTVYHCIKQTASSNVETYVGDGTGLLLWGSQLEESVYPGPYTKTVTAIAPVPGVKGNWRIHEYRNTGITSFTPALTGVVEVLVVGGGGGGGTSIYGAGGGGAGGVLYIQNYSVVSGKNYFIRVGAGGGNSTNGTNSIFGNLVAVGGGSTSRAGGSGGGGGHSSPGHPGGAGTVGQGHPGGRHVYISPYPCGGGGGAGGQGNDAQVSYGSGDGGPGVECDITGSTVFYGGGGGGTSYTAGGTTAGKGGVGGGGNGVWTGTGQAGLPNTGGGGGAGGGNGIGGSGGAGGSGIVVVRYRFD
jgi:hypothetical protein